MIKETILTVREMDVINKKLQNQRINQQDSNYLSKYVRPKLRKISSINAEALLQRLEYNQRAASIENKIKEIIIKEIREICGIVIYGSAIQTNYTDYNDIDVIIITKNKIWKNSNEKYKIISRLVKHAEEISLVLDIQIIDKK